MSLLDKVKKTVGFDEESVAPVDALIYSLKTDSKLPTLVVEGRDDQAIYTWMQRVLNAPLKVHTKINVQPAGNKDNVIAIYERKSEFEFRLPVAFMADLDKSVFDTRDTGYLSRYPDIIWTKGYSLDNDLYSDSNAENEIPSDQQETYQDYLDKAIKEFAEQVARWATPGTIPKSDSIDDYYEEIKADYKLKLRGKTLFEVLHRFCFCGARNHLELCRNVFDTINLESKSPPLLSRLIVDIQKKIQEKENDIKSTV